MTSGRPPWQILGDGQPGAEDEQGQPEPEEVAAAKASPERAEPAKAAAGAGQAPPRMLPAATVTARPPWEENPEAVSWPGLPGTGPRHASPVLSLSARLTALTQLIQIAAARTGAGGSPRA